MACAIGADKTAGTASGFVEFSVFARFEFVALCAGAFVSTSFCYWAAALAFVSLDLKLQG